MCACSPSVCAISKPPSPNTFPTSNVIVKDYHGGASRKTVAIPKELRYLNDYYGAADKSPFSTFHHYYHFGKPFDAIEAEIALLKPDVVGISSCSRRTSARRWK